MSQNSAQCDPATHNLMRTLNIAFTQISPDYLEATMPVNAHTCQPMGLLHGGATLALAESVAGLGSSQSCPPDLMAVGAQVSANHVHSAHLGDTVIAKGTLLHRGKTTHLWQIDVYNVSTDRLISTIRITNLLVPRHVK